MYSRSQISASGSGAFFSHIVGNINSAPNITQNIYYSVGESKIVDTAGKDISQGERDISGCPINISSSVKSSFGTAPGTWVYTSGNWPTLNIGIKPTDEQPTGP